MSRFDHDQGGQSHVLAILASALAVVSLVGLLGAQEKLLGGAHRGRAAEAAVQAAGAVVADEHLAFVMSLRDSDGRRREPTMDELLRLLSDPGLSERALAAARALALENRAAAPSAIAIVDRGDAIEVSVDSGVWHRVTVEKISCCRR